MSLLHQMTLKRARNRQSMRRAAAVVEFALLLPFLLIIFVTTVDLARSFYNVQVISDCARAAALFATNTDLSDRTSYESAGDFALKCVEELKPPPTIFFKMGIDSDNHDYVEATVSQDFTLICPLFFQSNYRLSRTARARIYPVELED